MAFTPRTIAEIYDAMITEKNTKTYLNGLQPNIDDSQTLLDNLNSTSMVAVWRMFIWLVAFSQYLFEQVMYQYQEDVDETISNSFVGSVKWYVNQTTLFQYGSGVTINDNYSVGYPVVDTDQQICEFASGEESGGALIIKTRRKDTDIFSTPELNALIEYLNTIKFAGTRITVINDPSDKLKLYMTIIFDPQYGESLIQSNIEDAINDYVQNIDFNSRFYVNTLVDRCQEINGVIDVQTDFTQSEIKPNSGVYIQLPYIYYPDSGWIEIDGSFPLSTTITYTKNPLN